MPTGDVGGPAVASVTKRGFFVNLGLGIDVECSCVSGMRQLFPGAGGSRPLGFFGHGIVSARGRAIARAGGPGVFRFSNFTLARFGSTR